MTAPHPTEPRASGSASVPEPRLSPWRAIDRALLAVVVLAVALLVGNGIFARHQNREIRKATSSVQHSHEVLQALQGVLELVLDAERGQRGYLLTGDPHDLDPYHAALREIGPRIQSVVDLTRDNLEQQERIGNVHRRVQTRLATMREGIEERSQLGGLGPETFAHLQRGRQEMENLRAEMAEMIRVERDLLERSRRRSDGIYRLAQTRNIVASLLALLILAGVSAVLHRQVRNRARAAAILAEKEERWRVTLASIGDAVIATDDRGCVTFLNPEAEKLTGWTDAEAGGRPLEQIFRIVSELTRAPAENPVEKVLRDGRVVGLANHTLLIGRDGAEHPIDDSAAPIRDATGRVVGVILVFRDVTEARKTDQELRALANELSEADRRKNEFLAMLAHELRNPLAPIRNSAQVLHARAVGDPADTGLLSLAGAIERQASHLVRLVDDLLDVSRISRGKIELRRERVDWRAITENAIEANRPLCDDAKQALTVELPDAPVWVDGDAARLTQSIGNLIHNACKYSDPGGRVSVSLRVEDENAVLRVRDTGVGIAPDHLERIFDMFAQVDTSLERSRGGLGIGLTLVKQFMDLHGGSVMVKSDGLGKGSEFTLRLPVLARSESGKSGPTRAPSPRDPAPRSTAAPDPSGAAGSLRILVVDDNVDSVETLSVLLRILGYESQPAHDGEEALALVESFEPEVVLLDIGLPRLNGYEVARRLRARESGARLTLIALTGWGQDEDRARSREAGFDAHLVKPVDHEELTRILSGIRR